MTAHTAKAGRFAGLLFSACLALLLNPVQAQAGPDPIPPLTIVLVDGKSYDVQFVNDVSFSANTAFLTNTTNAPWWGSEVKAKEFSVAYFEQMGSTALFPTFPPFGHSYLAFVFAVRDPYEFGYTADAESVYHTGTQIIQTNTSSGVDVADTNLSYAYVVPRASSVPEINAGSLAQALLILFALWLVTRRRVGAGVASAVPLLRADAAPPILRVSYKRHWQSLGVMRLLCSWKDAQ